MPVGSYLLGETTEMAAAKNHSDRMGYLNVAIAALWAFGFVGVSFGTFFALRRRKNDDLNEVLLA